MPFELGLMMGAKHFGGKKYNSKTALIMVSELYKMPAYLSDLSGSDPSCHHGQVSVVIDKVRRYLHQSPLGAPLPGAGHIGGSLKTFQMELPDLAAASRIRMDEVDSFSDYRTYAHFVTAFLTNKPAI